MSAIQTLKFWDRSNPYDDLGNALAAIRGGHDVVVLFPYDDGTFWLKGATFQKDLIGGQGGYETDDGDKIVVDGDGEPKRDLLGVPMVLAVDPTEHAAAVDPIKALVAQKNNIGEWLRVDREGAIVEVGPALKAAADSAVFADPDSDEHWTNEALEYDAVQDRLLAMGTDPEDASPELIQQAVAQVEQAAVDAAENDTDTSAGWQEYLPWGEDMDASIEQPPEPVDVDIADSMVGDRLREMGVEPDQATEAMTQTAMEQLAERGDLRKIYDIAPPAVPAVTDDGELVLDEATHIAVDQSKAADLLPTSTSSTELNVAIDKARMEEHEEGKIKTTLIHGIIIGAVLGAVMALLMGGLFALL